MIVEFFSDTISSSEAELKYLLDRNPTDSWRWEGPLIQNFQDWQEWKFFKWLFGPMKKIEPAWWVSSLKGFAESHHRDEFGSKPPSNEVNHCYLHSVRLIPKMMANLPDGSHIIKEDGWRIELPEQNVRVEAAQLASALVEFGIACLESDIEPDWPGETPGFG